MPTIFFKYSAVMNYVFGKTLLRLDEGSLGHTESQDRKDKQETSIIDGVRHEDDLFRARLCMYQEGLLEGEAISERPAVEVDQQTFV